MAKKKSDPEAGKSMTTDQFEHLEDTETPADEASESPEWQAMEERTGLEKHGKKKAKSVLGVQGSVTPRRVEGGGKHKPMSTKEMDS
jgi:hypothetical protein